MHTAILECESAVHPRPGDPAQSQAAAVLVVAAAAVAIIGPTLVALTHGWDYRLAVMLGAWIATGVFVLGLLALPATHVADRLSLESAAVHTAMLLCVYVADWFDWHPLGIDDALAGLTLGLVLLVAGHARRALRFAASAPGEASYALVLLAVAPAGLAHVAPYFGPMASGAAQGHATARLAGLGASLVLAWLGAAFARRRGLHGTALGLSVLVGAALLALLDDSGVPFASAAAIAAVAGGLTSLFALHAWCASTLARTGRLDGLLAALFIATVASLSMGVPVIGGLAAATGMGIWWWFYHREGLPLITWARAQPIEWGRSALSAVLYLAFAAVYLSHALLYLAAALNPTGPMLLALIGDMRLYRVSDFTFSEALLADQYLWRDEPAQAKRVAAASPGRLVRQMRTERDRWSGADLVAAARAREERTVTGVGLVTGPEGADGIAVSYVYPGSAAALAGVRRGDVVRAINGIPVDALRTGVAAGVPRSAGSTRLELASPGHAGRELTIAWAGYSRSAVSVAKVLDVAGRRVGYLVLHDFDRSAGVEFAVAAARLRAQGIDELVLDLRMNPGGSVSVARDVASAIGGRRVDGKTFLRIVHNERYRDSDHDIPFRSTKEGALSLPRLFVITSEESCSASEALISGLAPHMTVVTVGAATCGKPVGMTVVEYGDWTYWVITFRVLNARGEGDYFDGLSPTCPAEDDFAHELGDPAEASLAAALHFIRYGRCPEPASGAPGAS